MRLAYFDCSSGISGNMVLGALLDAGLPLEELRQGLAKLPVSGYEIEALKVRRRGLAGTHAQVHTETESTARHLSDILQIIEGSELPTPVKRRSMAIFTRLAEAEAHVHGSAVEEVHFHEVGGVDAIVDIVGSVLGLHLLGVDRVLSSALHVGTGTMRCAHGLLPVPAPATLELLKGVPTYGRDVEAELVTPTGAAILTTIADGYGAAPTMTVDQIGYGAGGRDLPWPNLLRISLGTVLDDEHSDEEDVVLVVETNIDDMNPEWYEPTMARLFAEGALDVFLTPIQMKRNRPAVQLSVITAEERVPQMLDALFEETTTIGVRMHAVRRRKLRRQSISVQTPFGPVEVKVAYRGGRTVNVSPEHRDCQRLADSASVPIKEVYQAALAAARTDLEKAGTA